MPLLDKTNPQQQVGAGDGGGEGVQVTARHSNDFSPGEFRDRAQLGRDTCMCQRDIKWYMLHNSLVSPFIAFFVIENDLQSLQEDFLCSERSN
jgi:hypothetical protein